MVDLFDIFVLEISLEGRGRPEILTTLVLSTLTPTASKLQELEG